MMRCIENAVAGGHISRADGEALQERINQLIREGLSPPEVRERLTKEMEAAAREAKRRGRLMELRRKVLTEAVLTHKNARGENDPAQALWMLIEHFGSAKFADIEHRRLAIIGDAHSDLAGLLREFKKGWLTGDKRRMADSRFADKAVVARMENVVRELFGEASGDARAAELATAWTEVAEGLRQRFNKAGGAIRKLEKWGLPQQHSVEALKKIGPDGWVDYLMRDGVLDRDRMVSQLTGERLTDGEMRDTLLKVWDRITTDGWIDRQPSEAPFGKGHLAAQLDDHHRFLHFKSSEQWMAYQKSFGEGEPFASMMSYIGWMARDIATMEILGPNPEAMRNYLQQLVLQQAAITPPISRTIRQETERIRKMLRNTIGGDFAEKWTDDMVRAMNQVADVERTMRRDGGGNQSHVQALREAMAEVDGLKKQLDLIETTAHAGRRVELEREVARIDGEIANVQSKNAPQLGGLSRRNRRRLEELRAERQQAADRLDLHEQADGSFGAAEPKQVRELFRAVERLRAEAAKVDIDAGGAPEGVRATADPMNSARASIARAESMWEMLRGTRFAPVNATVANVMQTSRNVMTSALLPFAMISALSDLVHQRHTRKFMGMPGGPLTLLSEYLHMFKPENRFEAVESGLILDSALHVLHTHARYTESVGIHTLSQSPGERAVAFSGYVADRVLGMSGMPAYTYAGKHAFGMALQREIGKLVHVPYFEQLPDLMRRALERHGIDQKGWAIMRKAELYEWQPGIGALRPKELARLDADLADRYHAMILRETRFAVPEASVQSRTWFAGGRPGTIIGEIGRNFGQFKGFAVAVSLMYGRRLAEEMNAGRTANGLQMVGGLALAGGIMGATVMELKEVLKGRDPVLLKYVRDGRAPGWEYWGAALMQAGGLGVYGDLLFHNTDRFGGGLASLLIGPLGGFADRMRTRVIGGLKDELNEDGKPRHVKDAIDTIRDVTPSVWYLHWMKERFLLNGLQRAFDPNADKVFQRMEQQQKKRLGNEFWWHPGDLAPARAPWPISNGPGAPPPARPAKRQDAGTEQIRDRRLGKQGVGVVGDRITQSERAPFSVIDGDTLDAGGRRYRIEGYDAPEVYSRSSGTGERQAGMRAALRLKELLMTGKAELEVVAPSDNFGRTRARLTVDGRDVGDIMRREGLVKPENKKPNDQRRQRRSEADPGRELLLQHFAGLVGLPEGAGEAEIRRQATADHAGWEKLVDHPNDGGQARTWVKGLRRMQQIMDESAAEQRSRDAA